MNREDFEILKSDIIYFDNAATTLKPKYLSEKISEYYNSYSANKSRGIYSIAHKTDLEYEETRENIKKFINAKDKRQIIFTNNTTDSINKIVFGYFKNVLNENDEVLLTVSEHASNILPWYELARNNKINIKFIELDKNNKLTVDNLLKSITNNTKVISIAHITNVIGDIRPIREIISIAHSRGIKVLIDGAQAIGHMSIDVSEIDPDFYVFSAHKMLGPTGVGVIYTKTDVINPIIFGGGMNDYFDIDGNIIYSDTPYKMEAGTPNISNIIGFNESIKYLNKIGMNKIEKYELELKKYLLNKLNNIENIIIYNKESETSIITFNIKGCTSLEVSNILSSHNICIRSGSHCAKVLKENIGISDTCRISLYFYNTKYECDKLIEVLKKIKN